MGFDFPIDVDDDLSTEELRTIVNYIELNNLLCRNSLILHSKYSLDYLSQLQEKFNKVIRNIKKIIEEREKMTPFAKQGE